MQSQTATRLEASEVYMGRVLEYYLPTQSSSSKILQVICSSLVSIQRFSSSPNPHAICLHLANENMIAKNP